MGNRYRRLPEPVFPEGTRPYGFAEKWFAHYKRQRDARTWKLARGRNDWVALPPRRDPKHPRGLVVGHSKATPNLRAYLGFERIDYDPPRRPAERLFLETCAFSTDPTDSRGDQRVSDLHYRRETIGGLGALVRQARVWFVCREDSRDCDFASPYHPRRHHPIL